MRTDPEDPVKVTLVGEQKTVSMWWDYRGYGYIEGDARWAQRPFAQVVHLLCGLYCVSTEGAYRTYDTVEEARSWAAREALKQGAGK